MFYAEFPHQITIERVTTLNDTSTYPPKQIQDKTITNTNAFLDTPSTSQKAEFKTLGVELSRMLYVPYNVDIKRSDVIVFEGVRYKLNGDLEDQGGQHEVNRVPLVRV